MTQILNEYFDQIYCINLDSKPARWKRVNTRFQENELCVHRFSAADGYSENLLQEYAVIRERLNKEEKIQPFYLQNSRALGCLISNIQIIEDAKRKGHQRILLFDDDVVFHRNFKSLIEKIISLPQWKLLYLGCSQHRWDGIEPRNTFSYEARHTHGTFAIGIDCSVFDDILELYSKKEKNCDVYLMDIQSKFPHECLVFFPNLVIADVRASLIRGGRHQNSHAEGVRWHLMDYKFS